MQQQGLLLRSKMIAIRAMPRAIIICAFAVSGVVGQGYLFAGQSLAQVPIFLRFLCVMVSWHIKILMENAVTSTCHLMQDTSLFSLDGTVFLKAQSDGNVVLYDNVTASKVQGPPHPDQSLFPKYVCVSSCEMNMQYHHRSERMLDLPSGTPAPMEHSSTLPADHATGVSNLSERQICTLKHYISWKCCSRMSYHL